MVNKCSLVSCRTNYTAKKSESQDDLTNPCFSFPDENDETFAVWVKFVNRKDWKPSACSRLCVDHFEGKYLNHGKQRITLNRKIKPIPTVYGEQILLSTAPSLLPAPRKIRKPPKERVSSIPDEIENFYEIDNIKSFEMLGETATPDGFSFKKFPDRVLF